MFKSIKNVNLEISSYVEKWNFIFPQWCLLWGYLRSYFDFKIHTYTKPRKIQKRIFSKDCFTLHFFKRKIARQQWIFLSCFRSSIFHFIFSCFSTHYWCKLFWILKQCLSWTTQTAVILAAWGQKQEQLLHRKGKLCARTNHTSFLFGLPHPATYLPSRKKGT